jgi:transposase
MIPATTKSRALRKNLRFDPIKAEDQVDVQELHWARERLVHNRTEVTNQIRGFVRTIQ